MSRVTTAKSPLHGVGVFSLTSFFPGEIVLKIDDSRVVTDANPLDPTRGELDHHCDYLAGGAVVLMQSPERFINHRCEPNTYIKTIAGDRYVVALHAVCLGDEITYDYCINGDGDTAWTCSCDSPACRKHHRFGFFHRPVDFQIRNLALLEEWFAAEHRAQVEDLKRRVAADFQEGPPAVDPWPARNDQPISGERPDQSSVVLRVNPPLAEHELATLFQAAWGDEAPDAPPALDRCLAHVGAYEAGHLVGFVKLARDGGDHAFILDTTVHPDYQRRGVGRRLVAQAAEIAQESGVEWLHVDYEPRFAQFYARCGFHLTPAGLIRLTDG